MFLPLKDDNPLRVIPFQAVTVGLIGLCVMVFLWQVSLPEPAASNAFFSFGAVPAVIFDYRDLPAAVAVLPGELTLVTSMFLHAGWLHLGGNMLYLWVFGDNIEDAMGHFRFIAFYLACGIAGALAHSLSDPASVVPMVGASGAIAGVLGAYLVLYPRVRVLMLVLFGIPIRLPAYIVLGGWVLLQVFNAYSGDTAAGGTAWWAHIGGFVTGVLLIGPMRRKGVPLFGGARK